MQLVRNFIRVWKFAIVALGIYLLLFLQGLLSIEKGYQSLDVQQDYQKISQTKDIKEISDSLVKPVVYQNVMSLGDLRVEEKKEKFISLLLPAILVVKFDLQQQLRKLDYLQQLKQENGGIVEKDQAFINNLMETYQTDTLPDLRKKIKPHPTSLVLAQAALECGWGTSRFFVEGNNIFGVWSYDSDEPRIRAGGGREVYVRKYQDLTESIRDYFGTLSRVSVYEAFREARVQTNDPLELIPYLKHYSELRGEYIKRLRLIIEKNNLTQYDQYRIHPDYLKVDKVRYVL